MEIKYVESADERIEGWYLWLDGDIPTDPLTWTWKDSGNGPEIVRPECVYGPYKSEAEAVKLNLGAIIIERFASWVGTDEEKLLEDGGIVEDHLSDELGRTPLNALDVDDWRGAWEEFREHVGTGGR